MTLLKVEGLRVAFREQGASHEVVKNVDLAIGASRTLGIIGGSGSGKSVLLRALMRLHPAASVSVSGKIEIAGHDMLALGERQLADLRGPVVSMVFQEPATALDPVYTIGAQLIEVVRRHQPMSHAAARAHAAELMEMVAVPAAQRRLASYPHELSGGLRQRAMIAIALAARPKLLLADEPTTALDATVQVQILLLLKRLQRELGMALVLVTHDIGVAAEMADEVAVMQLGQIVERGPAEEVLLRPSSAYAQSLLAAASG